jgi:hypothetical protein
LSKEVYPSESSEEAVSDSVDHDDSDDEVHHQVPSLQLFAFWAKLMVIGDAPTDICRYPSQTSVLARTGEGWDSLSTTDGVQPPIVELLD